MNKAVYVCSQVGLKGVSQNVIRVRQSKRIFIVGWVERVLPKS